MKTNIIVLLLALASTVLSNQARNRIKLQAKVKAKAKKLSLEQRNQANDMLQMLSQFLQKNGRKREELPDGKAPPEGEDKPEMEKEPPLKDPRFDDKAGIRDLLIQEKPEVAQKRKMPLLIMEDQHNLPTDYKDLEVTQECVLKQGYLGLVTDVSADKESKEPILTAKASFVVLNKKSLSFYEKENINSLIKTVDISHMKPSYYPVAWKGLFCWQLVPSNRIFLLESYIERGETALPENQTAGTMCAPTEELMEEWLKAIQRFHNCEVKPMPEDVPKEETELDKATGWYRTLKTRKVRTMADDEKEGDEDDENEIDLLKDYMKKFKSDILTKKAEESQERREKTVELEEAIDEAKVQEQQNECLDKALEIRGEEEEKEVEQMIQTESQLRETKELDKKKKELMKGLDKEAKRIIESQSDLTDAVRKMREEMRQKMVQTVTNLNRQTTPDMCYFMEFNFPIEVKTTSQRIKHQCETMVDIQNIDIDLTNQCLLPHSFCRVCCNYNIGELDPVEREKCTEQCNDQLTGDTPSDKFLMHFEVKPDLKKQKQDEKEFAAKVKEVQEKQMKEIVAEEEANEKKNEALKKENQEKEREKPKEEQNKE